MAPAFRNYFSYLLIHEQEMPVIQAYKDKLIEELTGSIALYLDAYDNAEDKGFLKDYAYPGQFYNMDEIQENIGRIIIDNRENKEKAKEELEKWFNTKGFSIYLTNDKNQGILNGNVYAGNDEFKILGKFLSLAISANYSDNRVIQHAISDPSGKIKITLRSSIDHWDVHIPRDDLSSAYIEQYFPNLKEYFGKEARGGEPDDRLARACLKDEIESYEQYEKEKKEKEKKEKVKLDAEPEPINLLKEKEKEKEEKARPIDEPEPINLLKEKPYYYFSFKNISIIATITLAVIALIFLKTIVLALAAIVGFSASFLLANHIKDHYFTKTGSRLDKSNDIPNTSTQAETTHQPSIMHALINSFSYYKELKTEANNSKNNLLTPKKPGDK
jgi:hypothetical protein